MKSIVASALPETVINSYTLNEQEEPSVYIEVEEVVVEPPIDPKGFCLNYSYIEQKKYKKFDSYFFGFRILETMFGRMEMPREYPPDVIVTDPSGYVIEYHSFEIPICFANNEIAEINKGCTNNGAIVEYSTDYQELVGKTIGSSEFVSKNSPIDANDINLNLVDIPFVDNINTPPLQSFNVPSYVVWDDVGNIIERSEGFLTPAECIKVMEDSINGDAFWKSSKRLLRSKQKPLKRLKNTHKQGKFSGKKVLKNELIVMRTIMGKENVSHQRGKPKMQSVLLRNKCKQFEVQEKQKPVTDEFAHMKDTALETLIEAKEKLETICRNFDVKIEKLHKKLGQIWRLFGKRKLRDEVTQYEEIRESYRAMFKDISADIDSRKAFTLF